MGKHEGVQEERKLPGNGVEAVSWTAAPPGVRAILAAWGAPGDAASLLPRERDPQALLVCYRDIAAAGTATRTALALLLENATLNAEFGLWEDLRREARAVLQWLAPLARSGALEIAQGIQYDIQQDARHAAEQNSTQASDKDFEQDAEQESLHDAARVAGGDAAIDGAIDGAIDAAIPPAAALHPARAQPAPAWPTSPVPPAPPCTFQGSAAIA